MPFLFLPPNCSMDFDLLKIHVGDGSFTFDSLVEPNGCQNLPHLYYGSNGHILPNIPSYDPPIFDDTSFQPNSNNAILLSSSDVNMTNSVGHILPNIPSYDPPIFDCTSFQPHSSNTILLSSSDVNTRNSVGHIFPNNPSYDPPIFGGTSSQPHNNNAILLSSGDVNTRNCVELAIGSIGSSDRNVDRLIYNNYQQKAMENNNQYMLDCIHVNESSPQLSPSVIHGIESHKSFLPSNLSSSPQLSASMIHGIEPHKSFQFSNFSSPLLSATASHGIEPNKSIPLNNISSSQLSASVIHGTVSQKSLPLDNLSNPAAERNKLLYDQGAHMNSNCIQVKDNGGNNSKKTNVVKGQWSLEEDSMLSRLVQQHGLRRWSHIARLLNGRIGKQCRERWQNHLRPDIKKDAWSEEEDKVLIQTHSEIGNKWSEIAKCLPGRTENSIKNCWNATMRRQFSRRSCRSSKYPKLGTLLQNYIKSITIASTPPTSLLTTEEQNSTCNVEWKGVVASSTMQPLNCAGNATTDIGHLNDTRLAPACPFNDAPNLVEKKNMHEMYDAAHLFDQLGCGYMASSKDFEMAMAWGAAIPPLMMPTSSENVNREWI